MILTQMRLQKQFNKAHRDAMRFQRQLEAEARRAEYERRKAAAKPKVRKTSSPSSPSSPVSSSSGNSSRNNRISTTNGNRTRPKRR